MSKVTTVSALAEAVRTLMAKILDGTDDLGSLPEGFPVEEVCEALFTDRQGPLRKRSGSPWGIKKGTPAEIHRIARAVRAKTMFHGGMNYNLHGLIMADFDVPKKDPYYVAVETMAVALLYVGGGNPNRGLDRWAQAIGGSREQAEQVINSQRI